ncbi:MAG: tryptophan-rich sensory protein [Patescibacteria group bacterium]
MKFNYKRLIISLALPQLAGMVGSLFTTSAIPTWYAVLQRPSFSPPNWVFGPVWVLLYILMGISVYLVWSSYAKATDGQRRRTIKIALGIFGVQLFLNAIWSIIFFGLKSPGWAFVDIILLWLAILATIIVFSKISRPAMLLLLPYILWVSFAGYLNYSIWTLNQIEPVACTMDAKLCPDGSYVERVAPNCEFAPCPETKTINLYYYNYELDRDEFGNTVCSRNGLAPVERKIPITQTPIQDTIKLLLLGKLTEEERAQGIDTEYPLEGFSLKDISLKDGVLTLEFDDSKNKTVGGSCRIGILWFQIEATAKQFPEVQQVRFLPEEIFQP